MFSCWWWRKSLALKAVGALEESRATGLGRHLGSCRPCSERLESLRAVLDALRSDPLLDREEPVNWERLRETTVARALAEASRPPALAPAWVLAAGAVAAVLAIALAWVFGFRPAPSEPDPAREAFLERMEMKQASLEAASYLAESKQLLLNLLAPTSCARAGELPSAADVSVERERSRDLLLKIRLLEPALARPELARARPVCEDLDLVLLEIARLPECAPAERLLEIEQMVRSRELLLRLGILAGEIG